MALKYIINKKNKKIYLRLQKGVDGDMSLVVCNGNGHRRQQGTLLTIDKEGLHLHVFVDTEFGFPLTNRGELKNV